MAGPAGGPQAGASKRRIVTLLAVAHGWPCRGLLEVRRCVRRSPDQVPLPSGRLLVLGALLPVSYLFTPKTTSTVTLNRSDQRRAGADIGAKPDGAFCEMSLYVVASSAESF